MKPRGFAAMSPERRLEAARKGAAATHGTGKAHRWTKEAAREAGRKGGLQTQAQARSRREVGDAEAEERVW